VCVCVGVGIYTYIIYIPTYIYMYLHIYVCVQTAEHTLLECAILREERERLIAAVAKTDNWPIKKICLSKNITKHSQNSRKRWTN